MSRPAFTHLRTPRSAVVLSEFDGCGSEWFTFQRYDGQHPDFRNESMPLVKTDLMHRSFSELPNDVQEIASQLELATEGMSVGASDGDSSGTLLVLILYLSVD